jgi:signal transduction histidine kinase
MALLTRQMLDQSRPLSEAATDVDLNQTVQRVLALAAPKLEAAEIETEVQLAEGLPTLRLHPDAMQQVLANLVDNAMDAMHGGGRLRVVTSFDDAEVRLEVEDSGAGIAPEHLPHVFEAFYTTKPGVRGIGLGLFVSEGIVRGHHGRLTAASRVGQGARFTVALPRERLEPMPPAGLAAAGEPAAGGRQQPAEV